MIRLSRLADYGIVIMTHLAQVPERQHAAPEIAQVARVPQPTTGKILKLLARAGLLVSHRGVHGGYTLARAPELVTIAAVIEALDGPIALTACSERDGGDCGIETLCPARANWQRINSAIRDALTGITIAEMARAIPEAFRLPGETSFHPSAGGRETPARPILGAG